MRFAPFAFEGSNLFSNLTVNLWQGDYTASGSTWNNSAGTIQPTGLLAGGFSKDANGVVLPGGYVNYFTLPTGGDWDSQPNWSIVIYSTITSTANTIMWKKCTTTLNGMSNLFSNNPYYFVRCPQSSQQIVTTALQNRGAGAKIAYTLTYGGATDALVYQNKTVQATSVAAGVNANLNNGFNFIFGSGASGSTTWGAVQSYTGSLNRLLIFNKKLSADEVATAIDYCTNNA